MQVPHVYFSPALRRWVVADPYTVGINGSTLTIPEGFLFDMASVPRILNPWIQKFELGTAAPLLHDWGYQHGGYWQSWPELVWSRPKVDKLFNDTMRCEGVSNWRRTLAYWAVRLFGWFAWKRKSSPEGELTRDVATPR